jgi:hypothetical protein
MINKIKNFNEFIFEGGWASKLTQSSVIKPSTIILAETFAVDFAEKFNKGRSYQIIPVSPVGSGIHYKEDVEKNPEKTYGDIDYLFKILGLEESKENMKRCISDLIEFLEKTDLSKIEKEESIRESKKGSVKLIVNLDTDNFYQFDMILAFDTYVNWTLGRMSPVKGYKGFVIGTLYSSLGKILKLSIAEQGVKTKLENDEPVDFAKRTSTKEILITRDFEEMFSEIAKYFAKRDHAEPRKLQNYEKLNNKELTLQIVCENIKKLFIDLDEIGTFKMWSQYNVKDAKNGLSQVIKDYDERLTKNSSSTKFDKAETESAITAAKKVKMQGAAALEEVKELLTT